VEQFGASSEKEKCTAFQTQTKPHILKQYGMCNIGVNRFSLIEVIF
jgi:hypothetical protein